MRAKQKEKVKVKLNRYVVSWDRSKEFDRITVARIYKKFSGVVIKPRSLGPTTMSSMKFLYTGPPRKFISNSGGVVCVQCGKVRNTLRSAEKHYKQAHGH